MSGQVAILTRGLWRLRRQVEVLTGYTPVRYWPLAGGPRFDAVAGWGRKSTAKRAQHLARRSNKPYLAIEDGFLRSVRPGAREPGFSFVLDKTGIYYDASQPSDLEALITRRAESKDAKILNRARAGIKLLRERQLSKYNDGALASRDAATTSGTKPGERVLVVDQTYNDASITQGLAGADSFKHMLQAAISENPDAEIIVKLHPDVVAGRKRGYLTGVDGENIRIVGDPINPWTLIEAVDKVYVVTSQFGFEALLAGRQVVCFGAPFYAGWGVTDDRAAIPRRRARPTIEQLFAAVYFDYARYISPYDGTEISFEDAANQLAFLRDCYHDNSVQSVCVNISHWKRKIIAAFLDGRGGVPIRRLSIGSAVRTAKRKQARVVTWASKCTPKLEQACELAQVPLVRIEDGFLRSVGLGAALIPGASISFDTRGIYYNAHQSSDLEYLLETADLDADMIARAKELRLAILRQRLTKYNVGGASSEQFFDPDRPGVLVPGQVEDDASIRETISNTVQAGAAESVNLSLLRAARERNSDAFIIFKPHPDVVAGLRKGVLGKNEAEQYADRIVEKVSILPLIEQCDAVETLSSLVGFESLLREKKVTTHGLPFYSGWGLTTDLVTSERRTRKRSLDELVAIVLILYSRYADPVSLLRCTPEYIVERLSKLRDESDAILA